MRDLNAQKSIEIVLPLVSDTERLGFELASRVHVHTLVTLIGPLGAGKTTFAKGAGMALGVEEVISSPTFTMLNEYVAGRIPLYHLDLYRLHEAAELRSSGDPGSNATVELLEQELDELAGANGLILIEWPDVLDDYIRLHEFLCVELNYSDTSSDDTNAYASALENGRTARITGHGARLVQIVESLAIVYFS